jgi:hypothetical protein
MRVSAQRLRIVELVQLFSHRYFPSFTESFNTRLQLVLSSLGLILFFFFFLIPSFSL